MITYSKNLFKSGYMKQREELKRLKAELAKFGFNLKLERPYTGPSWRVFASKYQLNGQKFVLINNSLDTRTKVLLLRDILKEIREAESLHQDRSVRR
jgi:hypothetical protein